MHSNPSGVGAPPAPVHASAPNCDNAIRGLVATEGDSQRGRRCERELLAVVAHELRSPLAPVRTAAALLGRLHPDDAVVAQIKAIIERQVAHMSRLIDDLLDASRVGLHDFRVERHSVRLGELVDSAIESCSAAMQAREQQFTGPDSGLDMLVFVDPGRMVQVLTNLMDNASKYTPERGHIALSIHVDGDELSITIADDGIGITAAALEKVFDPFVQDVRAAAINANGLGIGLAVVRGLVASHGGRVVASSGGDGAGSRFTVTIPLRAAMAAD